MICKIIKVVFFVFISIPTGIALLTVIEIAYALKNK